MSEALPDPGPAPGAPVPASEASRRGKLKIFFGAFPGAGKTNAMLNAAKRVRDSGREVVAAVVDAHESSDRMLLQGFEMLPAGQVGGVPAPGELDLDSALARHPQGPPLDDLAHAQPPAARHPKRWKDVDQLLSSAIDGYTTMSVQHLESLNDVVGGVC